MPEFKTTAKDVAAPFVKRTASAVEILGTSYEVHFTRGEGDKGWRAFASASVDSANASGKTLDGAVYALKSHMEDVATADAMGNDVTDMDAPTVEPAKEETDETPKGEDAPRVKAVSGAEAAAMIAKAVADARDAYVSGSGNANRAAMDACTMVADMAEGARLGGTNDDVVRRLYTYGTKVAEHYYGKTGGGDGILTDAQRSRALKKLRKVCAELAA